MSHPNQSRSFADVIRDLRDESTTLLRQEVALAKAEMTEKASKASRNIAFIVAGGAIAHLGLIFLLLAISGAIEMGIETTSWAEHGDWIGPLIVGLVVGLVGALLIYKAIRSLSNMTVTPERTLQTIQEHKEWAEQKVA